MTSSGPTSLGAEHDDAAILSRLQAGDDAAFEQVLAVHGQRLMAAARRITGNDADAQDAFQDGMISAFRAIDRFEGQSKLSTWLHRIVVNAALQILRKKRRSRVTSINDLLPRYLDDGHQVGPIATWSELPDDRLQSDEMRAFIREQIEQLPDDYRDVILLRDIEELDTEDTATVLGISAGAVKTRLHRARQALRSLLERGLA